MSLRTCDKPSDKGFENRFEVDFQNIPAVAYFSQKAYDYYEPPFIDPEDFSPIAAPFELRLQGSFHEDLQGAFEFLLVSGSGNTDRALMRSYGDIRGYKLFDGRVFFFRHVKNFEPPFPTERVDRLGILGVTNRFEFGFFRQIDALGSGYPDLEGGPQLDFQIFSSPFVALKEAHRFPDAEDFCETDLEDETLSGGMFYKELLIEAGSPVALAETVGKGRGSHRMLF
ncbi:MAG: hypothetical protein AAF560_08135 [Acidobacteriota bacterium]